MTFSAQSNPIKQVTAIFATDIRPLVLLFPFTLTVRANMRSTEMFANPCMQCLVADVVSFPVEMLLLLLEAVERNTRRFGERTGTDFETTEPPTNCHLRHAEFRGNRMGA